MRGLLNHFFASGVNLPMNTIMLSASLLGLVIGPVLFHYIRYRSHWYRLLDGFVVVMISGIVLLEVLPEILAHHAILGLALLGVGLMGPTFLEHQFHRIARQVHWAALYLAIAGLVIHAFVDGVILSEVSGTFLSSESLLSVGVILHRIPVGLTIWMLFAPRLGRWKAIMILGVLALGTVIGFTYEMVSGHWSGGDGMVLFQALAAGSILHVVIHRPHEYHQEKMQGKPSRFSRYGEGIGNIIGLGVLILIIVLHAGVEDGHHSHFQDYYGDLGPIFLDLAIESAPALLLAYLVGGLVYSLLPSTSIQWMKKGPPLVRSVKGVAVGLPLPICTCGVLPLYQSLIQRGAPPTAAMAFLIATPELGLDALLISIPLLGADMTVIRLVAAGIIALTVGFGVGLMVERTFPDKAAIGMVKEDSSAEPLRARIKQGLRHGFGPLVDDTAPWILVGLIVAALADPLLRDGWLSGVPTYLEVLLFAMLGLPIYVCASGATPIVAILLINNVSPGAALAFLLTGPATNISTYGILSQVHSKRIAIMFGVLTTLIAVFLGYLVNLGIPYIDVLSAVDIGAEEDGVWKQVALALLLLIFLISFVRRGARAFVGEVTSNFQFGGGHSHEDLPASSGCKSGHCDHCGPTGVADGPKLEKSIT